MHNPDNELVAPSDWKKPVQDILKVTLMFCILTFLLAYGIVQHHRVSFFLLSIAIVSYFFSMIACAWYLIKKLPIAVLMLLIPIAPLFIMLYLIALIAILQNFS